jgi:hypothetical protein
MLFVTQYVTKSVTTVRELYEEILKMGLQVFHRGEFLKIPCSPRALESEGGWANAISSRSEIYLMRRDKFRDKRRTVFQ